MEPRATAGNLRQGGMMKYKEKIDSILLDTAISWRYQGVSIAEIERELNLDRECLPAWVREYDFAKARLDQSLARALRAGDSPPYLL